MDVVTRYNIIHDDYGEFEGKTLIDIGYGNGYFIHQFLRDGGRSALGVEVEDKLPADDFVFDIGLYLKVHFCKNTCHYPGYLGKHTKVLYASCAALNTGNGQSDTDKFKEILSRNFREIIPVHNMCEQRGRILYRCK